MSDIDYFKNSFLEANDILKLNPGSILFDGYSGGFCVFLGIQFIEANVFKIKIKYFKDNAVYIFGFSNWGLVVSL